MVRPLAVSESAKTLLRETVPVVKTVHQSGVTIAIPGNNEVIYLGPPGAGLLPLHVVVRTRDFVRLVRQLGEADSPPQGIRLDLDGVRVFRLAMEIAVDGLQSPRTRIAVDQVGGWLRTSPDTCGLGMPVAQALSLHGTIRNTLAEVDAGTKSAADALRALIGRGAGSTPAGDDILVGALAYAFAAGSRNAALVQAMLALMPEFDQLTTATAATYLRAAVQGKFDSDLLAFVRALPKLPAGRAFHRAMRVATHGATSGVDSLMGFVAAYEAARSADVRADGSTGAVPTLGLKSQPE